MSKRQEMARAGAARAMADPGYGFTVLTSDVRDYGRHLLHELELLDAAPVRIVVHLANGARVNIKVTKEAGSSGGPATTGSAPEQSPAPPPGETSGGSSAVTAGERRGAAKGFPVAVELKDGRELVAVSLPGVRFVVCCHGARALALMLNEVADHGYCDGYRHGDESTMFDSLTIGPGGAS